MAIFEDIELDWKGVTYRIRGDGQVMQAIAAAEEHITLIELEQSWRAGRPPLGRISAAYAAILRLAGARVTAAEVYDGMWEGGASPAAIREAVMSLMAMMTPPRRLAELQEESDEAEPAKEDREPAEAGPKKKSSRQSARRTKRR